MSCNSENPIVKLSVDYPILEEYIGLCNQYIKDQITKQTKILKDNLTSCKELNNQLVNSITTKNKLIKQKNNEIDLLKEALAIERERVSTYQRDQNTMDTVRRKNIELIECVHEMARNFLIPEDQEKLRKLIN